MSDQKDDLKDLFNSAFAAENVEFSPAAWEGMNTMLDQKQRKRGFWLWMSGGLATLALIAASVPFFLQEKNVYEPRILGQKVLSQSLLNLTDINIDNTNSPQRYFPNNQAENTPSTAASQNNQQSTTPEHVENTGVLAAASQPVKSIIPSSNTTIPTKQTIAKAPKNNLEPEIEIIASEPTPNTVEAPDNASGNPVSDEATIVANNSTTSQVTRASENLGYLPILSNDLNSESNIIIRENEEVESLKDGSRWNHYMVFGLTRALSSNFKPYPNWGQRFGVGTSLKLRNHLYISGELAMALDAVDIVTVTTANKYGLSKTVIDQETTTSELLFAEMPILLHYRYNRVKLGGGPMLQYLTGVKNNETRTTQTANGTVLSEDLQSGYYSWNQFKRFNLGLILDASYQIGEPIYIGVRNNFGLTNILSTDQILRQSRLEFYIKLDLP
jgi:hypothetical protein